MRKLLILLALLPTYSLLFCQSKQLDSLIKRANSLPEDTTKVNAYFDVSNFLYRKMGKEEKRFVLYHDSGIHLSEKIGFAKGIIRGGLIGAMRVRDFGNYELSLAYLDKVENLSIQNKDSANLLNVYLSRASTFLVQGSYHLSAEMCFKALALAEILKDKSKQGRIYNNLGNLYMEQSDCRKAVFYHKLALKHRLESGDTLRISHSYVNLGSSYHICKEYDSSTYFFTKALQLQKIKRNEVGQAYSYDGIANNNLMKGKNSIALSYFLRSQKLLSGSDDINEQLENFLGLGKTYLNLGNKDSALRYFTKYRIIVETINKVSGKQLIYEQLANYHEKAGDFMEALRYNKLYHMYRDSISGSSYAKNITALEYNRQMEQVEKIKRLEEEQNKLIHEKEVQKQRNIIYYFIIGSAIMILFLFYFYRNNKQKAKANKIILEQKLEVEAKNEVIEEKQKEILDSIRYAKRIQSALLAHKDYIDTHLKNNFIVFKPKDIVSGDFYWAAHKDDRFYLASCDSTGHGVPGAFMSLLNIGFLGEAIKEKNIHEPNKIFNYVRERLIEGISKEGQKDGFDGILICVDKKSNSLTYAAANNAPIVVRDGKIIELECDRMPVGIGESNKSFSLFTFDVKPSDIFYLYTDGYPDQFGGPKGKKYMYKRFNELLLSVSSKPLQEQAELITQEFYNWKGELEQIDDVCVMAVKF